MPNPQDEILVALMRGPKRGMSVTEISVVVDRADSTIRNNLGVCMNPYAGGAWVREIEGRPRRYMLTEAGREVARHRARASHL